MNIYEKRHHKFIEEVNHQNKKGSPLKAIRHFCLECIGYQFAEIKDCQGFDCPLYKFRFGRNLSSKKK